MTSISQRAIAGGAVLLATSLLAPGCATQQQTGTGVGAALGALAGAAIGAATTNDPAERNRRIAMGAAAGLVAGGFAGSAIGARLDAADRQRAEAAAQRAMAERDAAVQRALVARNGEIERQLRAEAAQARSAAERAEAEARAAQAREAARREVTAAAPAEAAPVAWTGNARGSAQAVGPVQVAGRTDCEQVREIAIIQGQEVRQNATFCRDPRTGTRTRV